MYQVCYTRWRISNVLKVCEVPKNFDQDCTYFAVITTGQSIVSIRNNLSCRRGFVVLFPKNKTLQTKN